MTATLGRPDPRFPEGTEDLDADLYIHSTTPVLTVSRDGAPPEVYVTAAAFMEVQKERDEYRRVLALINAWRVGAARPEARLRQLLAGVGEGDAQGEATLDIIRWAQGQGGQ